VGELFAGWSSWCDFRGAQGGFPSWKIRQLPFIQHINIRWDVNIPLQFPLRVVPAVEPMCDLVITRFAGLADFRWDWLGTALVLQCIKPGNS
jgi:hypothetical protein